MTVPCIKLTHQLFGLFFTGFTIVVLVECNCIRGRGESLYQNCASASPAVIAGIGRADATGTQNYLWRPSPNTGLHIHRMYALSITDFRGGNIRISPSKLVRRNQILVSK